MSREPVIDSSGNVFVDLGFSAEESTLLAMRAELMTRLRDTIKQRGWMQQEAAEKLGIGQSRVSDADAWQMGKIQPGYADYVNHSHRLACGAGCRVRVIASAQVEFSAINPARASLLTLSSNVLY